MSASFDSLQVPLGMHLLSGFVHCTRPAWVWLGNLETFTLHGELAATAIDRPIYITGLARGGTTILLEFLARSREVATHRYRDFPCVFIPTWWDKGYRGGSHANQPRQRAHGDGLAVTPDSPEAIEECLWMAFFAHLHDPESSSVLDEQTTNRPFEKFYLAHIRKLLHTRCGSRYGAKGNYNLTRINYLLKLFPDARFVVAVRHPKNHIASLVKQHRLFSEGEALYPRALAYMQRVGHYEFGLDRRPICVGDVEVTRDILALWEAGEEVRGWSRYWASLYGWLAHRLENDPQLSAAVQVVRYEDLCAAPEQILGDVHDHCELNDRSVAAEFAARIAAPDYYQPSFTPAEETVIDEETAQVAQAFGYPQVTCGQQAVAASR